MTQLWARLTALRNPTTCQRHLTSPISFHLPLTASKCFYPKPEPRSVQRAVSPDLPLHCVKLKPLTAVAGCHLEVDIILKSSDGTRFGSHVSNLETYSDAFPPSEFRNTNTPLIEVVSLSESSDVISLLLQYMHNQRHPDSSKIKFDVLSQLAEAAEKYMVFSATQVCKIHMKCVFHIFACRFALRYATEQPYQITPFQSCSTLRYTTIQT
jgi:hypothetical protein